MMNTLRSLAAALAFAVVPASPIMGPTAAYAHPAAPEKLWDGFSAPVGMAFDAAGNLFVAEWGAGRVSRIDRAGNRITFADGLSGPSGLTIGPDGTIYVASYSRDEVYRFTPAGERSVHVTGLATPAGLSFDRSGRLLIANRRTNQILTVTGNGGLEPVIDGLRTPVGAVQTPDNGYVVSNIGGGVTILRPDGSRIEAGEAFGTPGPGVATTKDGRVFVVDYGGTTVREILADGQSRAVADGLRSPVGLVVAPDGASLLTAAWGDGTIYRIPIPN
ncbi:Serine/threonine-protein kinase [uncultured Pleomorphomonas sp.]|uniref:Serine/threonine-protein kinase n=1 Tax=uncultured Pleomorphomonas sp. TaxID=442121 RepID=A0A212L0V9_9HYPH|nr:NHL repeat-containing protein [uncultured Pleomorphomonas sp.]SCM71160.1 Serine/threonine-protein kinase [uncultured Pleomorphomonas sp.]